VYEEPFWRTDGLTGQSVATASPLEMTLDASPVTGVPGVLAEFAFGPHGRALGAQDPGERRRVVLETLTTRFGPRAAHPVHYEDIDWATEPWTRGCSMAHMPPGGRPQVRPAPARAGRPHPWGGPRDRHGVARHHRRRDPVGRTRRRRGAPSRLRPLQPHQPHDHPLHAAIRLLPCRECSEWWGIS